MNDLRDEIREILFKNDKTVKWLAEQTRKFSYNQLYYALSQKSATFDTSMYNEIVKIFKSEGMISSEAERCTHLLNQILKIDSIIGHSLTLLNDNVAEFTKDNIIDFKEKKRLSDMIDKIENEFTSEVSRIKKIIEK